MSRTWRASTGACVFSWRELTSWFLDVATGKPLSDIFMLDRLCIFFSPRGITLTKFVFPLDFFLNSLVRGKEKTSPWSARTSPMFGPKVWELLIKRQESCYELQCSGGMEQGSDPYKLLIQIWNKIFLKKEKASFQDIFDIFKGSENRRGRGVGEKCCFISCL